MKLQCIVSTKQFLGSQKKYFMLKQRGFVDTDEDWHFTPFYKDPSTKKRYWRGHIITFGSEQTFLKYAISCENYQIAPKKTPWPKRLKQLFFKYKSILHERKSKSKR